MARERHDCRNGQKYRYGEGGSIREMCKDKSGRCTCRAFLCAGARCFGRALVALDLRPFHSKRAMCCEPWEAVSTSLTLRLLEETGEFITKH